MGKQKLENPLKILRNRVGKLFSQEQLLNGLNALITSHRRELEELGAYVEQKDKVIGFGKTSISKWENGNPSRWAEGHLKPSREQLLLLIYFFKSKGKTELGEADHLLRYFGYPALDTLTEQPLIFEKSINVKTDTDIKLTTLENDQTPKSVSDPSFDGLPLLCINQDDILLKLGSELQQGSVIGLWGTYGSGKTAIINKFRKQLENTPHPCFPEESFKFDLAKIEDRDTFLRRFATELVPNSQAEPLTTITLAFKKSRRIIILEGIDQAKKNDLMEHVRELLSLIECNSIILTSREPIPETPKTFFVPPLSDEHAYQLLKYWVQEQTPDMQSVQPIFELIGNLPMAIELIAKQIRFDPKFKELREGLEQNALDELVRILKNQCNSSEDRITPVIATCVPSDEIVRDILGQATIFDFASFHRSMLIDVIDPPEKYTHKAISEALQTLVSRGLLLPPIDDEYEFSSVLIYEYARHHIGGLLTEANSQRIESNLQKTFESKKDKSDALVDKLLGHTLKILQHWIDKGVWVRTEIIAYSIHAVFDLSQRPTVRRETIDVGLKSVEVRINTSRRKSDVEKLNNLYAKWLYRSACYHSDSGELLTAIKEFEDAELLVKDEKLISQIRAGLATVHLKNDDPQKACDVVERSSAAKHADTDLGDQCIRLNTYGLAYLRTGRLEKAINFFKKALDLAQKNDKLKQQEMICECNLGDAYAAQGAPESALGCYERAIDLAVQCKDLIKLVKYLGKAGNVYSSNGQLGKARSCFTRALRISYDKLKNRNLAALQRRYLAKLNPRRKRLSSMDSLGFEVQSIKDGNFANIELDSLQRKLVIARSTDNIFEQLLVLINIGNFQRLSWKLKDAVSYYRQALLLARELQDERTEELICMVLGKIFYQFGETKLGLNYYETSLTISQGIRDSRNQIIDFRNQIACLAEIGALHIDLGHISDALQSLDQAYSIAKERDYRLGKGVVLTSFAVICYYRGDYDSARKYSNDSIGALEKSGDIIGVVTALNWLNYILNAKGELNDALAQSQKALTVARDSQNQRGMCQSLICIGNTYYFLKQMDEAEQNYVNALKIAVDLGDRRSECAAIGNIARILCARNQANEAITKFQYSLNIADQIGHRLLKAIQLNGISDAFKAVDDNEHAKSYGKQARQIYRAAIKTDMNVTFLGNSRIRNNIPELS